MVIVKQSIRRDIPWFEWLYKINTLWDILILSKKILKKWKYPFLSKEKIAKQYTTIGWYMMVGLTKKWTQKLFLVHRLVAQVFIPNPEKKPFVTHKDWVRNNNIISNLERCTRSDSKKTHWMFWTKIYWIRHWIKTRCYNKNRNRYKDYWGRWISICKKWMKFEWFYEDMWPTYKDGLTIDRIDNNWNYCKNNCKWSTYKEQANNRRRSV